MKFKYTILCIFLLLIIHVQSQSNFNANDYKVSNSDLLLAKYEKDSLANALVIYEFGKSHIDDKNFDLIFEFKQKLKILNRNGFDKADITIYLYNTRSSKETIDDIFATTYNIEGGKVTSVKLEKNQIFKEKYNENYTLVKFSMPNIKPGSVITYSYKINSPFIYKYKPWRFQSNIPKLYSEYQASIPGNYEYNIKLVGELKLDKNEHSIKKHCVNGGNGATADCLETTYVMKNIPAFIDESFMTTQDNYLSRVDYELKVIKRFDGTIDNITKTWKTTDKELEVDPNLGKQMKKKGIIKKLLSNDILIEKNQLEKSKSIFEFVQNNFIWNGKFNIFKDVSIKELLKVKKGNVSEINLLLYNLLKEQNINVTPVLLSTRNNGFPTKIYPVISDFNYIIIQTIIDGEKYYLDATNKYLDFGELPFRCLNQYGRLLNFKNGSEWVSIQAKKTSVKQYNVNLNISDSLIIKGNVNLKATGYHALPMKSNYYNNPVDYFNLYKKTHPDIEFSNFKIKNESKNSFLFEELFDIKMETELIGDNLYINPFIFNFFDTNPFKLQERTYPIDFGYKDSYLYSLKFDIDKEIEIVDIPKEVLYKLPHNKGQVILKSLKNNNTIRIYFKFDFREPIYDSSYYKTLKEYMSKVIDVQRNSLIVLKIKG